MGSLPTTSQNKTCQISGSAQYTLKRLDVPCPLAVTVWSGATAIPGIATSVTNTYPSVSAVYAFVMSAIGIFTTNASLLAAYCANRSLHSKMNMPSTNQNTVNHQ